MKRFAPILSLALLLFLSGCGGKKPIPEADVPVQPEAAPVEKAAKEEPKKAEPVQPEADTKGMVYLSGGVFRMGTANDPYGDKPLHTVTVGPFYIDATEVTNRDYQAFLEQHPNLRKPAYIDDQLLGADDLPVVDVTWGEALAYCKARNKTLPTEAQWEFAARGGKNSDYPWGAKPHPKRLNYRFSGNGWALPVAQFPPNPYGLFDMTGNVREWTLDTYDRYFYRESSTVEPVNLKNGLFKTTRGGSWSYAEGYPPNVAFRGFDGISTSHRDLGFRCVTESPKKP